MKLHRTEIIEAVTLVIFIIGILVTGGSDYHQNNDAAFWRQFAIGVAIMLASPAFYWVAKRVPRRRRRLVAYRSFKD